MKTKTDLVKGWLMKAESDLASARVCLSTGQALDTACFHAQQAAEKYIKVYLLAYEMDFPFVHNLEKLIELGAPRDAGFHRLKPLAQTLTPYAVELRYDIEFWPTAETARQALAAAVTIKNFVLERLPADMRLEEQPEQEGKTISL